MWGVWVADNKNQSDNTHLDHIQEEDVSTHESRHFVVDSCVQVWGRKTAVSYVATPTSVCFTADFIIPVRPKLLVKVSVRKVAEVNPNETLG